MRRGDRGPTRSRKGLFFNWARTRSCTPSSFHRPRSELEVVEHVRRACRLGARVKVVGAAHSWSGIAMTDGVLLSLDELAGVLSIQRDDAGARARVLAGTRLQALIDALARRGLALPIVGSVSAQSVAGAISTGTHGSSLTHGNLSSLVCGARLITGTGERLELEEGDPRLAGVRLGLGALGILTEVTLRCVPLFQLHEHAAPAPFDEVVEALPQLAADAEYLKLWWLPPSRYVQVFRYTRTRDRGKRYAASRWLDERVVNRVLFPGLLRLGRRAPGLIDAMNAMISRTYFRPSSKTGRWDRVLTLAMPPRHREVEYGVPLPRASEALTRLRALIERERVAVNFIQEMRFVPADDTWLSGAYARDSCQLGAYMANAPGIERFFAGFEREMQALNGRPHFGKEHSATPPQLRAVFPRYDDFLRLRAELDPRDVFLNASLERTLLGRSPDPVVRP